MSFLCCNKSCLTLSPSLLNIYSKDTMRPAGELVERRWPRVSQCQSGFEAAKDVVYSLAFYPCGAIDYTFTLKKMKDKHIENKIRQLQLNNEKKCNTFTSSPTVISPWKGSTLSRSRISSS